MYSALEFACGRYSKKEDVRTKLLSFSLISSRFSLYFSFGMTFFFLLLQSIEPWGDKSNAEVIDAVLKKERLPKPEGCPNELYEIMMKCWRHNPDERPSFGELLTEFLNFVKATTPEKQDLTPIGAKPV